MSSVFSKPTSPIAALPTEEEFTKKPSKTGWGPVAGLLYGLVIAFFGGAFIAGVLITFILGLFGMDTKAVGDWYSSAYGGLIYAMTSAVFTASLVVLYVKRRGGTLTQLGITPFRWKYLSSAIAGIAVYLIVYICVASLLQAFIPAFNLDQKQDLGFADPTSGVQLGMIFMALVILPPMIEELVFRGFIFTGVRRRFNMLVTSLITSVVFAVGHLQLGSGAPLLWSAATDTFILSMVMCYVRERTGSIIPTIIMHMLKNLLAFYYLYIFVS